MDNKQYKANKLHFKYASPTIRLISYSVKLNGCTFKTGTGSFRFLFFSYIIRNQPLELIAARYCRKKNFARFKTQNMKLQVFVSIERTRTTAPDRIRDVLTILNNGFSIEASVDGSQAESSLGTGVCDVLCHKVWIAMSFGVVVLPHCQNPNLLHNPFVQLELVIFFVTASELFVLWQ